MPVIFNAPADKPIEPDKEKHKIASSFVVGNVIKRKSEQSINLNSIMWLGLGVFIIWFWGYQLNKTNEKALEKQIARETRIANIMNPSSSGGDSFVIGNVTTTPRPDIVSNNATALATFFYTPTHTITSTPAATVTPTTTGTPLYSIYYVFRYSYYNPKLGGVNCAIWDAAANDCASLMANGEDWRNQYGLAVACPPEFALGTIIEVLYPDALQGLWTCKDRGGAIVGNIIDFLDITQRAQWLEAVAVKVYPPTTPMEEITKGTH